MQKLMNLLGFSYCDMCDRWNRTSQGCWYDIYQWQYWEHMWRPIFCLFRQHTPVQTSDFKTSWISCNWCHKVLPSGTKPTLPFNR